MLEISELIYATCKTYLFTQAKFIAILEGFIAVVIVLYYGVIKGEPASIVLIILGFSVLGILGAGRSRGSASGSTPSRTPARPSRRSRASPSPATPSRSRPG